MHVSNPILCDLQIIILNSKYLDALFLRRVITNIKAYHQSLLFFIQLGIMLVVLTGREFIASTYPFTRKICKRTDLCKPTIPGLYKPHIMPSCNAKHGILSNYKVF
jgi:hypothetical protein